MWQTPQPVPAPLGAVALCSWRATVRGEHRLVPDGCVDVLWLVGSPAVWVCGPERRAWTFRMRPGTNAVGVRLRPGAAHRLLRTDVSELRDLRVTVGACLGDAAERRLVDALHRGADPLPSLEQAIGRWAALADPPHPLETALVRHATARSPRPLAAVAAEAGVTERALHRRAVRSFGYGASVLTRLVRFQRAIWLARTRPWGSLASLAAMAGYADQAHFARECRDITGDPPSVFLPAADVTFPGTSDPFKPSAAATG